MAILQASDCPSNLGHLGMKRLIRRCHINSVEDSRSWRRCQISLAAE